MSRLRRSAREVALVLLAISLAWAFLRRGRAHDASASPAGACPPPPVFQSLPICLQADPASGVCLVYAFVLVDPAPPLRLPADDAGAPPATAGALQP